MQIKKILCVILAIVLCLTATIVVVTANTKEASIQISSEKAEISTGESTTVSVKVTTNFPVATMSLPVFYDKTLVSVSDATATLTDYSVKNVTTEAQSVNSSKIYANTGINEDNYGFILVTYIGSAGTDVAASIDEVVLTFNITAKSDATGEVAVKCVPESAKTTDNIAGMLYFGSPASGTTIDSVPENVEKIDFTAASQTVNIKNNSEPNTLVLNENAPFEAIIDLVNCGDFTGAIYGFDTLGFNEDWAVDGTIADFVTTAYGDEYLEVVVGDAGVETTGTIVNVLDENGEVVESYVYIYFGDIDMDGNVGASDAGIAENYEIMYEGFETLYQFMAGDLDGDAMPGASDAGIMENWEIMYEGMPYQADVGIVAYDIPYEIF